MCGHCLDSDSKVPTVKRHLQDNWGTSQYAVKILLIVLLAVILTLWL